MTVSPDKLREWRDACEKLHPADQYWACSDCCPGARTRTLLAFAAPQLLDELDAAVERGNELRKMLVDVLTSAYPNERDHPTMSKQWKLAMELLGRLP